MEALTVKLYLTQQNEKEAIFYKINVMKICVSFSERMKVNKGRVEIVMNTYWKLPGNSKQPYELSQSSAA